MALPGQESWRVLCSGLWCRTWLSSMSLDRPTSWELGPKQGCGACGEGAPRLAGPLWPMQALSLSPSRPGQRLSRPPPPAPFWPLISLTEPCYL